MILSKNEIIVLKHLADHKQHSDIPEGLTDSQFYTAAKSLKEKNMVYAIFASGGTVMSIEIKHAGQAALDDMLEEDVSKTKQKTSVISNDELDMLFDTVLIKLDFFRDLGYSEDVWDDCLPYLERLVNHQSPKLYISRIKNELRILSEGKRPSTWGFKIRLSCIISIQIYVILYYRFRDNEDYTQYILPSLKEMLGYFDGVHCPFSNTLKLLEKLPEHFDKRKELGIPKADDKKVRDLETRIIELQNEISGLVNENTNFRKEISTLKELQTDDPEDEQIIIETGMGTKIKYHKTSARKVAQCVVNSGKLDVMQKQEWEELLSDITGLSKSSIHKHIR